jgi:ABC-2 type transport system permease protein
MTRFLAIVRVTVRQTLGLKRAIGLGLLSVSAAGTYFVTSLGQGSNLSANQAFDVFLGLSVGTFLNIIIPVVTLILATSVLGDERRDTTMSFLVLRPVSRVTIAAAKVTAAIVECFLLTGLGALALGIVSAPRLGTTAYIIPLLVGTLVATAAYCAVFVPVGYLLKRATLIGLTYVFVWENGIGGAIPALAGISPWRIGISAMAALAPSEFLAQLPQFAIGDLAAGAGGAAVKALILIALSSLAVASILRRRDLAV